MPICLRTSCDDCWHTGCQQLPHSDVVWDRKLGQIRSAIIRWAIRQVTFVHSEYVKCHCGSSQPISVRIEGAKL